MYNFRDLPGPDKIAGWMDRQKSQSLYAPSPRRKGQNNGHSGLETQQPATVYLTNASFCTEKCCTKCIPLVSWQKWMSLLSAMLQDRWGRGYSTHKIHPHLYGYWPLTSRRLAISSRSRPSRVHYKTMRGGIRILMSQRLSSLCKWLYNTTRITITLQYSLTITITSRALVYKLYHDRLYYKAEVSLY